MRVAIFLSTFGGSPLQGGIERGLMELGHEVHCYRPGMTYDLIVVFNQCAHRTDYRYPDFPDGNTPIVFVDSAEYGYFKRLPTVVRQYATAFTDAAMDHDTKARSEQERLRRFLEGRSFPYFLREFSNYVEFPASYHPIDYPLYHLSKCDDRPNREEYLRRDLELFCAWGHSHPWRKRIEEQLRCSHRKAEIAGIDRNRSRWLLDRDGLWKEPEPDMPRRWVIVVPPPPFVALGAPVALGHFYDQDGNVSQVDQWAYFNRTRAAKCSVSFDGYGSGSFRMTEVLCRTLLLQGPLSIRTRAPLVDGVTCRTYEVEHAGETFLGTNVAEVMADALSDPEGSYAIHERGYDHCMTHLTEKATAAYLIKTVEAHDWSKPTPLVV